MSTVVDITAEREKRTPRVTSGTRVQQVLHRAQEMKAERIAEEQRALQRGDRVKCTDGREGWVRGFHTRTPNAFVAVNGDLHSIPLDTLFLATPECVA